MQICIALTENLSYLQLQMNGSSCYKFLALLYELIRYIYREREREGEREAERERWTPRSMRLTAATMDIHV
jgi:hypothetical protein